MFWSSLATQTSSYSNTRTLVPAAEGRTFLSAMLSNVILTGVTSQICFCKQRDLNIFVYL